MGRGIIMNGFDIPIVLFIFMRKEKVLQILDRIAQVEPKKIYIISDAGRNEKEQNEVLECRSAVEKKINWDCQIIKNYASENAGVYDRIGLGAKWVFTQEDVAIFLEDDNLPETSFFPYCREMLIKYRDDTRILWVCGTNYLQKYVPEDGASYVFTKHLMPCGWASWSNKFISFYDGDMKLLDDKSLVKRVKNQYKDKRLFEQMYRFVMNEKSRVNRNMRPVSWDYQMAFSIMANSLYGISPCYNQIENIGVDNCSIHGGSNINKIMTQRFCGIKSYPLEFPLTHPITVIPDTTYEKKVGKIILRPFRIRVKVFITRNIKRAFGIPLDQGLVMKIKSVLKK